MATLQVVAQCLWAPPAGVDELLGQVLVEWDRMPSRVCRNVVESKPRRIGAVIKAKGAQTAMKLVIPTVPDRDQQLEIHMHCWESDLWEERGMGTMAYRLVRPNSQVTAQKHNSHPICLGGKCSD